MAKWNEVLTVRAAALFGIFMYVSAFVIVWLYAPIEFITGKDVAVASLILPVLAIWDAKWGSSSATTRKVVRQLAISILLVLMLFFIGVKH